MSLEAETDGRCTTLPMRFCGRRLEINAWVGYGGEIRVELADASIETGVGKELAKPIASHAFEDCDPITGNHLQHTVTWRGESDLSTWRGKPLRMRLRMHRARCYAVQFA